MRITHTHTQGNRKNLALKSQSAMEYLVTYGWAVLAIAIVMVSLYSLGIFNAANLKPTANPGACEVVRTVAQTSLAGQCNNLIPKYVAQFNGQNSYISITSQSSFSTPQQFTVAAWVEPYNNTVYRNIFATNCFRFEISSSPSTIDGDLYGDTCGGTGNLANTALPTIVNSFKFYVLTYNASGSIEKSYYDGVFFSQGGASIPYTGNNIATMHIGMDGVSGVGGADRMNGLIANVQVYNTSLDSSSIAALYQEGIGGAPIDVRHLVGWWPLNGNANDYSGNSNQGTPTSVVWNANWQSGYTAPST